jgi:DNA-damage-inducible protein D
MGEFSIEKFEADCRENGVRFWYAHEFMRSLGYDSWSSFKRVITKAMGSCARLGIDPTDSFVPATCVDNGKEISTYKLSRFACFLVSMNADSGKPEVAKAKTILAAIADKLIEERIAETDLGRIETREDLKLAERAMTGVAKAAGLERQLDYAIFKDAGFRGMYNMSISDLSRRKGIDPSKTMYDFMNLEELAGNLFRVTQTTARVKTRGVQGLDALKFTAKIVGKEVRTMMIQNSGIAPEELPIGENIKTVQSRLKSASRAMKKFDAKKKAGNELPRLPLPDPQ